MLPQGMLSGIQQVIPPLERGPMPSPSGQLLPTGGSAGPGGFDEEAAGVAGQALLGGEAASASDMAADGPDGSGGIGLMGTLGILNMGMGLGGQIFKMVTSGRPKPQKRRMSVPTPGGNAFR